MKQSINFSQFCDAFHGDYANNFSYQAKRELFDYLENLEADTEVDYNLDVVDLCCTFGEYASLEDIQNDYPRIESIEDLQNATKIIYQSDDLIIITKF